MYYLLNKHKDKLYNTYNDILNEITKDIINNKIDNMEDIISYIHSFFDIYIEYDNDIIPYICDIPSDGLFALLGNNICRNMNKFLYDILSKLNYKVELQYIKIDNDTWYRLDNSRGANHIVVKILYNNEILYLDLTNRLYFNDKLEFIDINKYNGIININTDKIDILDNIIDFYRVHEKLGVEHVYEYSIH